ncbi:MAG: hypothetical protein HON90_11375, partial [Halobacteriovoraceae bacterium]|nr:hypothetical protein [Halobacteriovoraceae bacterium]
ELFKLKAPIIFYHITDNDSYTGLDNILNELSFTKDSYRPIIVSFNNPSKTQALQKAYNYEKILSTSSKPTLASLAKMITLLKEKDESSAFSFNKNDPKLVGHYNFDIKITSVTENEMSFSTPLEIPLYTIIKISLPIEMYLLVIPPFIKLSPKVDEFHYHSFIIGLNEYGSNYMRQYVNLFIRNTPKEWGYIDFEIIANEDNNNNEIDQKDLKKIAPIDNKKESKSKLIEANRPKSRGFKSKL